MIRFSSLKNNFSSTYYKKLQESDSFWKRGIFNCKQISSLQHLYSNGKDFTYNAAKKKTIAVYSNVTKMFSTMQQMTSVTARPWTKLSPLYHHKIEL